MCCWCAGPPVVHHGTGEQKRKGVPGLFGLLGRHGSAWVSPRLAVVVDGEWEFEVRRRSVRDGLG